MHMERLSENIPSFCLRGGDLNIIFFKILGLRSARQGFTDCSVVKNSPASAGHMGWIPDRGGSHVPRSN